MRYCLLFLLVVWATWLLANTNLLSQYEPFIEVKTFSEKDEKFITPIKEDLSALIVPFQNKLRSVQDIHITINIAPDRKTYNEWVKNSAVVFQNSVGFTELLENQIFIKNPLELKGHKQMMNLLLHEYIHIFINSHWGDAPRWFHEGMAGYFSEDVSLNSIFNFMTNNAFHNKFLLAQYAYAYPEHKMNLEPFYFQSALLIKRAYEEDSQRFEKLFEIGEIDHRFVTAFQAAFNMSTDDFLANFNKYLNHFFKVSIYIGILILSWLLFPILLIIAKFRKDYQTKKLLAEWETEEDLIEEYTEIEQTPTPTQEGAN
jgi:hypothetical protein